MRERRGDRSRRWRGKKAEDKKAFVTLVAGLALLTVCAFCGELQRAKGEAVLTGREDPSRPFGQPGQERLSGLPGRPDGEEAVRQTELWAYPSGGQNALTEEEQLFLHALEAFFAKATIEEAAGELGKAQKVLERIFSAGSPQETIYIAGQKIGTSLEGEGMAVRADGACFYGDFHQGRPDGICTAIRCQAGTPAWYEYAMGIWKDGQMEGLGIVGKRYLGDKKGGQLLETRSTGFFSKDRLNGELTYLQVDREGEQRLWEIRADAGRTCLDERWIFLVERAEYRLPSAKDGRIQFLLPENEAEKVWWENPVKWETMAEK